MTEFALIVLLLYDMLATAFTFAFCSHVYASAGCCTKDKDGKAEMSKRAAALVACLDLCTTQCRTSLPQRDTVLELWALSNSFTLEWADDPRTAIAEDACEVRPCEAIINSLARMLLALIFIIDLPALVEGSSSDSNNKPAGLREAHNQAAAATRAARVLKQRRLAERGPFPVDVVFLVASTMQVVDTVFVFFARHSVNICDSNNRPKRTAALAGKLFLGFRLVESLVVICTHMLDCVRCHNHSHLQQIPTAHLYPPLEQILSAACENICFVATHLPDAIVSLNSPELETVFNQLPKRFFATVACLACEGTMPNHEAAWGVSQLLCNASFDRVPGVSAINLLHGPAMRLLSRHSIATAIATEQYELQLILKTVRAFHPALGSHKLLSDNICARFGLLATGSPPSSNMDSEEDESYPLFPRAKDTSLHRLVDLLPVRSHATNTRNESFVPFYNGVLTGRMLAMALSMVRIPKMEDAKADEACGLGLQQDLLVVARYVSSLTTRLLHQERSRHTGCSPTTREEGALTAEDGGDQAQCIICSVKAEAMTAILLQILRLSQPEYDEESGIATAGEPKH